jgi:hypothetical protein
MIDDSRPPLREVASALLERGIKGRTIANRMPVISFGERDILRHSVIDLEQFAPPARTPPPQREGVGITWQAGCRAAPNRQLAVTLDKNSEGGPNSFGNIDHIGLGQVATRAGQW